MTTIAFKDGVMACDSCFSYGNSIDTLSTKIYRLRSGALLGQAGSNDARIFIHLLDSIKKPEALPSYEVLAQMRVGFLGLLVFPSKRIFKIATMFTSPENWTEDNEEDLGVWEVEHRFTAIGTGSDFAVGAMEAGADARKAVRIACKRDMSSRLPVHSLSLGGTYAKKSLRN